MPLAAGSRLGAYEILSPLGAGGMGEVYRARDTRLDRAVAIKILPESFAHDPERRARFEREAKTLAALNHPNIGGIHGLEEANGVTALVLELVEGATLCDRITQGPIPADEALPIAKQIALALEAAHEEGIVHRDLKPANVKLRPDGAVKVLDFGLAKAMASAGQSSANLTFSPTITSPVMTGVGVLLGTAAYMAPEQARGRPVDRRADIWAFGCVLFEMLTGRRPFDGEDVAETLGAVIHKDPAWNLLPATTPPVVVRLLQRCLVKDPKQRLRDIGDARLEIEGALNPTRHVATAAAVPAPRSWMSSAGWLIAAALGLVAIGVGGVHFMERQPDPAPPVRFEIAPPDKTILTTGGIISPDGRLIAFAARNDRGLVSIWVRALDSVAGRLLAGTEARNVGLALFWSPDSRFIGYSAEGKLRKVDVAGGPPQTLADLEGTAFRGGAWSRAGVIIFGLQGKGLRQVSADGGSVSALTTVDPSRETSHIEPTFLPDGRHFLYTRLVNPRDQSAVYLGAVEGTGETANATRLLFASSGVAFAPAIGNVGQLLFVRGTTLMAQPFDAARVQLAGEAVPLAENLPDIGARAFSASTTGVLAFRRADATPGSRLIWFDRRGKSLGEVGQAALYGDVNLAPDEKTVVVSQRAPQSEMPHLWLIDLQRQAPSRLNPGDVLDIAPAISRDGRIAFRSGVSGDIYSRSASGAGEPVLLLHSANAKHPNDWSADGRFIIYDEQHPSRRGDLWVLPLDGDRKPIPFLTTPANESLAQFSPDGRWVLYSSDESGRTEVYVRDFAPERVPAVGTARITISTAGGSRPRWRPDGREIYYIAPGGKMMAVPVKTEPTLEPGVAAPLFDTHVTGTFPYDVTADGRFLVNTIAEQESTSSPPITIVMNWLASVKP
jgi:eukaryotic-like serine/threonine-protein kinase